MRRCGLLLLSVAEPPSGYGPPYPVTTLVLTPSSPTTTFAVSITSPPPMPYHDPVWYDLDLSAFVNGGTLYINGYIGDSCTVSAFLIAQCEMTSPTGSFPSLEGVETSLAAAGHSELPIPRRDDRAAFRH